MSDEETGVFSFRASRFIDTSFKVHGETAEQSTRTGDRGILISDDGEQRAETLRNITYKKRRLRLRPSKLNDSLAQWIPVPEDKTGELNEELRATLNGISATDEGRKRKLYVTSDHPMHEFQGVQQDFLNELLRLCGLGDSIDDPECALCHLKLNPKATAPVDEHAAQEDGTVSAPPAETPVDRRIFRCSDCGEFLQCKQCCLGRHAWTPLHLLKLWKDGCWEDDTLKNIGLIYQLGHQGAPCLTPNPTIRLMVVLDTTGIHQIHYRQCGCDRSDQMNPRQELLRNAWFPASAIDPDTCATLRVLEAFRLYNVIGNLNCHDFVTAQERKTSALGSTGVVKMPDRYREMLRMARQHSFLTIAKRNALAHAPGVWRQLSRGRWWRDVEAKYRYLYRTILALDANFKLKNRIRTHEREDPPLAPGWGAWVDPMRYKEHLKQYIAENDASTCIAFAALTQKDTRHTDGLRVSGVGAAVCARHECVRPNGLGDLQKGERYANMDFIAMSAVAGFDGMELTFSYDIACQWGKNLRERVKKLPEDLRLDFEAILFQTGLPVWHASSHEAECTNMNSLSFLPGVGKTDGEGIERLWAELNAFAYHTKQMGLGHRADSLEDKINYHNFMKNLGLGDILRRKLLVAIAEREKQVAAWKEVNKSIPTEVRAAWQERVDAFLADRTAPNPYLISAKDGLSEADIRAALKADKVEAASKGTTPLHGTSATAFLTAGLQLEDTQRRIKAEIAGTTLVTANRESEIQESRLAFLSKLRVFRGLQEVYTPAAIRAVERLERNRNPDAAAVKAENIKLFLPSDLTEAEMEAKLREAQCGDAVGGTVGGQHGATRANSLVGQISDRIAALSLKYNHARAALLRLKGPNYAPFFKPLKESDLTLDADVNDDEASGKKRLSLAAAGKGGRTPRHVAGTSRKVLSWIWAARGALDPDESDLHESLRVEWARAKARKTRWDEEVNLLREEMRRVLRYLEWETQTWRAHTTASRDAGDLPIATRAGLEAYAIKQAAVHERLRAFFYAKLNVSLDAAAASVLDDEGALNPLFEGTHKCNQN
ncbi:hypothetical protein C8F04DRAFT_1263687 [Mycena alexandri]|uniref:CxC2-like cysteine cluster KDZ transposase-associated domain-containing protein n=1 Tax=Mycena alexandri TaxID=1745969 RepID=A0AAD6SQD8_9AGAR|nr:hypothetical protein C8F04DRAFT_1263687 [Mycena alexandri]